MNSVGWDEFRRQVLPGLGTEPAGAYALGATPEESDALLELVLRGPKRAQAAAAAETRAPDAPPPASGRHWILLDGRGEPGCVVRTEETRTAPLYAVDAAFVWEHGEGDRTRARWLAAQEDTLRGQGVTDLERELMLFERFSVVWPRRDEPQWWLPGVRELRGHEPAPDGPRPDLPALASFDGERVTGVLRFEPVPRDLRLVSVTADDPRDEALLRQALTLRRQADRTRV